MLYPTYSAVRIQNVLPLLLIASLSGAACHGTEVQITTVKVTTADGRVWQGQLDERTDHQAVWVRYERAGISLTNSVRWDLVSQATVDGQSVAPESLRVAYREQVPSADSLAAQGQPRTFTRPLVRPRVTSDLSKPSRKAVALQLLDAYVVNLDRDVEPDGLRIHFVATDSNGQPVSVRGSLYAELWTERHPWHETRPEFAARERWSQSLKLASSVDGATTVTLPFRSIRPQRELDLLPTGLLSVRLSVFGTGELAASVPVGLRPDNLYRDRLQNAHGTRFVRGELGGAWPSARTPGSQLGRGYNRGYTGHFQ